MEGRPPFQCVILSDSLIALQSLEGESDSVLVKEIKYYLYVFSNRRVEVAFGLVPSHVRIRGNEVVGELAKAALGQF